MPEKSKTTCFSKAAEFVVGANFEPPIGGTSLMGDKPVSWELVADGSSYQKYLDTPVYLDAMTKSDTSKQMTDENGVSQVQLTGKPQPKSLENMKVVPLQKTVVLRASIAQEKMDFKEDFKNDSSPFKAVSKKLRELDAPPKGSTEAPKP